MRREMTCDPAGNLSNVTELEDGILQAQATVSYTWDVLGRQVSETLRGLTHTHRSGILAQFAWTHDEAGNVVSQTETWPGASGRTAGLRRTEMAYDGANHLLTETVTAPGPVVTLTSYAYDAAANRTGKIVAVNAATQTSTAYTYNAANQLTGWTETTGTGNRSASLTYDKRGNRTGQEVTPSGGSAQVTAYTWDDQNRLSMGGLLYSLRGNEPRFNLSNGRGDSVAQSDTAGGLTWTASYEAFGKRPEETGQTPTARGPIRKRRIPRGCSTSTSATGTWKPASG